MDQKVGGAAIASIIAGIASFAFTCTARPFFGVIAAIVALIAGGIGFLMAASPRVRGGMISIAAMVLGALGVIVGVLGMFGKLVF